MNIWAELPKPFFVLAPMDDVTDTVFRQIVAAAAAPDLFFTEFANADGLQSAGRSAVERKLQFTEIERPLIAQIWGKDPERYYQTARELQRRGFAGIDINMGCPVKTVVKNGCCAALIENRELAAELIAAVKAGAPSLPLSVKTRIGFRHIDTEEWCGWLLSQNLAALTLHARTAAEQSKVPAHWEEVAVTVRLRDRHAPNTRIIGNGDVISREHGEELARQTGADGIMIGRGIFQNPWVFSRSAAPDAAAHIELLIKHLRLFDETWGQTKSFATLKKFFKIYVTGTVEAAKLRARLMDCADVEETLKVLSTLKSEKTTA